MEQKISTLNGKISTKEKVFADFQTIKFEMEAVKKKVATYELLQNEFDVLCDEAAKLENMSLATDLRISRISSTQDEELHHIFTMICEFLKIETPVVQIIFRSIFKLIMLKLY